MTTTPYKFQSRDQRKIDKFNLRALVAYDRGLGKTFFSLLTAENFLEPTDNVVVICPMSVKYQWERQSIEHVGRRAEVLEKMKHVPGRKPGPPGTIYVTTYKTLGNPESNKRRTWLRFLKRVRPKLVVVDECQMICSPHSIRTQAVQSLCEGVPGVLMLSGDPFANSPAELFPALNILRPDVFKNQFAFAYRYTYARKGPWGWQFKGGRRLKSLHRLLLKTCMVRRVKEDVLKDMPAKTLAVVPVEIERRKEYEKVWDEFVGFVKNGMHGRDSVAKAFEMVNRVKTLTCELKRAAVAEWVEDFLRSGRKLVLFGTRNKSLLLPLYERFKGRAALITGAVTGRKRDAAKDRFVQDPACRLLVANLLAAGTGMDGLQRACADGAFADVAWTSAAHNQGEDRIHRIGQNAPVTWTYLVARKTYEEKILQTVRAKQLSLDGALDGSVDKGSRFDVFDEFLKGVKKWTK